MEKDPKLKPPLDATRPPKVQAEGHAADAAPHADFDEFARWLAAEEREDDALERLAREVSRVTGREI